ncbi:hypothetical protein [Paenibacillus qinlingensis]|uniref:Uncharacterized protein n=1 Tax=Paenibacillus qinlingensis TaxID=1837343 RepID=A0ABU1NVP6_9BACL|nr:hypothetical protein [Paenibacillus qinlingensis]MDR6551553.1 hypothetical protein [Paenibacillus qinlingensis]
MSDELQEQLTIIQKLNIRYGWSVKRTITLYNPSLSVFNANNEKVALIGAVNEYGSIRTGFTTYFADSKEVRGYLIEWANANGATLNDSRFNEEIKNKLGQSADKRSELISFYSGKVKISYKGSLVGADAGFIVMGIILN